MNEDEELPEPPALFITIRQSLDDGEIEIDIGDLPLIAARGLMQFAMSEMDDCRPDVLLRSGDAIYCAMHGMHSEDDMMEEEEGEE